MKATGAHEVEAVIAIIGAYDFCGDEREALAEYQADNDVVFTDEQTHGIWRKAADMVAASKQEAGVMAGRTA